jgi:hypothetical protein
MGIRFDRWAARLAAMSVLVAAPALAPAEEAGRNPEASGSLLFTVREAGVLATRDFEASFLLDNYDRDPLGIDVVDGSVALRLGLLSRLEVCLGYQITRSVSTPGAHPVPSPPLDIVLLGGSAPAHPYRAMYWPMPYLSHHPARVEEMVPGEYTLGTRVSLLEGRRRRPALTLGARVTGPGTTARFDLSKGSGSGGTDVGFHAEATWSLERLRVSGNLGVSLTGDLDPGDRLIVPGQEPVQSGIRRPNFLHAGIGARLRLLPGLSAVAEVSGWGPFGARTPMQAESGASDLLAGLLLEVKQLTLALGLRWHLRPQVHGQSLPTGPLAGAVDLSSLREDERSQFLATLGTSAQRHDANLVVVGLPSEIGLPDGARILAPSYETSTRGNLGVALRLSFRLGR